MRTAGLLIYVIIALWSLGKIRAAGDSVGVNSFFAELGVEPKESEG